MSLAADPWSTTSSSTDSTAEEPASLQFEDNFEPERSAPHDDGRLPDSDSYLAALERRLKRIKTNPTVLQQLAERREACMQYLLNDSNAANYRADAQLLDQLDEPVFNHELLRLIKPEQALSVAELVHLVKYDHLEPEEPAAAEDLAGGKEQGGGGGGEESGTESSTSR